MVALLVAGAGGFALLAIGEPAPFVVGVFVAFALGWGWPGLFNLAVVDLHREAPGAATGISQSGIYVGAAGGPALYGALSEERMRPPQRLVEMQKTGRLGRKTGEGFFRYG